MPVSNAEVAEAFQRFADLLEIQGANVFRVRAYRNAARTIGELPESVTAMLARGDDLTELPGIGKDLAGKIACFVETRRIEGLDTLEKQLPGELAQMMRLPGLGPKRVHALHEQLHVTTLEDLRAAAEAGNVRALRGFGAKTEAAILDALGKGRGKREARTPLAAAEQIAAPLLQYLRAGGRVGECVAAGSFRRRRESVGDLDVLVTSSSGADVVERFVAYEDVGAVLAKGTTRSTVRLRGGMQLDLRVVEESSYGAALVYFTGSKAHNIALRKIAVTKRLKLNEYGLFRGTRRVACRTEREVYRALGLAYIEPELREDRGEIEAALRGGLPTLVRTGDIRGDLHVHTDATDGTDTLKRMAESAQARGYEYIAITDHTQHLAMVHGLDARRLRRQIEQIDRLNRKLDGFTILKSAEVDILENGTLDLPDDVLAELDLTVCSIHSHFGLSEQKQTERVLRAMDDEHFTIWGHPTGRLMGKREPYPIDLDRLVRAARERGCFVELNAQPERLDLNDAQCRLAKELGVKVAVSTDAHRASDFEKMRFGVDQARRGWLEPADVLNTRSLRELRRCLRRA